MSAHDAIGRQVHAASSVPRCLDHRRGEQAHQHQCRRWNQWLAPERVAAHFRHNAPSRVERFDLPGCNAMNTCTTCSAAAAWRRFAPTTWPIPTTWRLPLALEAAGSTHAYLFRQMPPGRAGFLQRGDARQRSTNLHWSGRRHRPTADVKGSPVMKLHSHTTLALMPPLVASPDARDRSMHPPAAPRSRHRLAAAPVAGARVVPRAHPHPTRAAARRRRLFARHRMPASR